MKKIDRLLKFEQLCSCLIDDRPPSVHIASRVMTLIRVGEQATFRTSERTLEAMAATSFVLAMAVALLGFTQLSQAGGPLDALFQIVPPIGP